MIFKTQKYADAFAELEAAGVLMEIDPDNEEYGNFKICADGGFVSVHERSLAGSRALVLDILDTHGLYAIWETQGRLLVTCSGQTSEQAPTLPGHPPKVHTYVHNMELPGGLDENLGKGGRALLHQVHAA